MAEQNGEGTRRLPIAVTVNDMYLAAVVEELRGLRADLAAAPEVTNTINSPATLVIDTDAQTVGFKKPGWWERLIGAAN